MGRRIGAFVIDLIPQYLFAYIVFAIMAEKKSETLNNLAPGENVHTYFNINDHAIVGGGKLTLFLLIWLVFSFIYNAVLEGTQGWTPGKAAVGIRVVNAQGQIPGIGAATVRWLFWFVDAFVSWLVGLITALATENNQRVGDLVAKTYVVDKQWVGTPLPLGGYAPAPGGYYPQAPGAYPAAPPPGLSPEAPQQAAKPDWYPDPSGQARLRYWDGQQWTDNTA
jgi:uncharacterized RDD family membrane protein YckC